MRYLLIFIMLFSAPLCAWPFSYFFDCVDRDDLEKVMETLEKMKPKVKPLPYFRAMTRGLAAAMVWHFRQEISREQARNRAVDEIYRANISEEEKDDLIEIIDYLSEESETLWQKGKGLFKKKKKEEPPPFKIEAVEIY